MAAIGGAIDEDAALAQRGERLAVAGQAVVELVVVGAGRRRREFEIERPEVVERGVEIVAGQRDVLDALAVVRPEVLGDLAFPVLAAFLVERDADLAVGRHHHLGVEP